MTTLKEEIKGVFQDAAIPPGREPRIKPVPRSKKPEGPLRWWRVELDSAGAVVAIRAVERPGSKATTVYYVQAGSDAEASRLAWNAYCRNIQQRRRTRLKEEGKCQWCSNPNDREAGKRCSVCLEKERKHAENKRARVRGETVRIPNREEVNAARKTELERRVRLETLIEVRAAWQGSSTIGIFTSWLAVEITELTGKAAS